MKNRRDFVAEIQGRRARSSEYPSTTPRRLRDLAAAFERAKSDPELLRYFPIALVAILEGFFRLALAELLDQEPFLDRFLESSFGRDQKFEVSILKAVAGKSITIGELAGHLVPMQSVAQIETLMSAAIGESFLGGIRVVHSRWAVEVEGKPKVPIIADLDATLRALTNAFQRRHIYAHELAEDHGITSPDVAAQVAATTSFLDASAEFIGELLHPKAPLQQQTMNQKAAADFADVDRQLSTKIAEIVERLAMQSRTSMAMALSTAQRAFTDYRDAQAVFEGSVVEGGSMQPMVEYAVREELTKQRLEHLDKVWLGPE